MTVRSSFKLVFESPWLKYMSTIMAAENPRDIKRQKLTKTIGTHNGTFHCDEALAVFLLRQTDIYRGAGVERTRDPDRLAKCDIVVDVGAVYDESKNRFDHHQRGFTEVFGYGFQTKLSSAGLIYKHFGKEIIATRTNIPVSDPNVQTIWLKLYLGFIEAIDGVDNGVSQYPNEITPKYINRTDLSSRVGALNPAWNQPSDSQTVNARFEKASELAGLEFLDKLDYYANAWLPARDLLVSAISASRNGVDPSGKVILLEQFLPWKQHLFDLEADENVPSVKAEQAVYIVYPDETAHNWRVQAVSLRPDSFESRRALPEPWRGLRDEELSKVSGIAGCIFVHASGFIGGNLTKAGALQLAKAALAL